MASIKKQCATCGASVDIPTEMFLVLEQEALSRPDGDETIILCDICGGPLYGPDEKYPTAAEAEEASMSPDVESVPEVKVPEVYDIIQICRAWDRMGSAVQDQLEDVLDGRGDDINSNALPLMQDFLETVNDHNVMADSELQTVYQMMDERGMS